MIGLSEIVRRLASGSRRSCPLVVFLIVILGSTGCSAQPADGDDTGAPAVATVAPSGAASDAGPLTIAVVGDSLTAGSSPDFPARIDSSTWSAQLSAAPIDIVGGWAVRGATTAEMRDGVRPVDADVLVIMAGTNDVTQHYPLPTIEANLLAIQQIVGIDRVLLSAIPPDVLAPEYAVTCNAALERLAAAQGWAWVDPWTATRDGNRYRDGDSVDGVHPVPTAARTAGLAMRAALEALAGRRSPGSTDSHPPTQVES